jgi:hypothetical protein
VSEESVKVASLVEKLAGWVESQPEYPYLFLADRGRRKRAATIVAKRLLLIPAITPDPNSVDRATYRKQNRAVQKFVAGMKTQMSEKAARQERQAAKMKQRYAALSMERTHELALKFNAEFDRRVAMLEAARAELAAAEAAQYDGDEFQYADEDGPLTNMTLGAVVQEEGAVDEGDTVDSLTLE